jgi:hypothetical protein
MERNKVCSERFILSRQHTVHWTLPDMSSVRMSAPVDVCCVLCYGDCVAFRRRFLIK